MGDVVPFKRRAPVAAERAVTINGRNFVLVAERDAAKLLGVPEDRVMDKLQPAVIVASAIYYDKAALLALGEKDAV
jgi:hypothetical protein